jgi:hypothetical protein
MRLGGNCGRAKACFSIVSYHASVIGNPTYRLAPAAANPLLRHLSIEATQTDGSRNIKRLDG